MAPSTAKEKVPRRHSPVGAVLVDGKWQLTQESVHAAVERILKYREHIRKRYRKMRMRELLRAEHPELFAQLDPQQSLLAPCSEEKVFDLTFYRRSSREEEPAAPHTTGA